MTGELKIAVLIDGENISANYADTLFQKIAVYGDALVKKVYVSPTLNGWKPEIVFKHAVDMVVKPVYVSGKNVLDIALVLDAMDLMHAKKEIINCFCIVSNDSDFALLAMRLRENGIKVIGFGEHHAVDSFVNACDDFVRLDNINGEKKEDKPETDQKAPKVQPQFDSVEHDSIKSAKKILIHAVNALSGQANDSGWLSLGLIMPYIKRINPDFNVRSYGCKQLKGLVEKTGCFDIKTGKGSSTAVYVKEKEKHK